MKSNQPNSSARKANSAPASSSPASVPISVYRELAAELQATRAMVDSLNNNNQQLDRENQQLRQEMQRVVYAVMALQPWINAAPNGAWVASPAQAQPQPLTIDRPSWEETAAATAIAARLRNSAEAQSDDPWLTEIGTTPPQNQTKPSGKLGGFWLTLTILVVVISAFGAGFLIMRPFLPTSANGK